MYSLKKILTRNLIINMILVMLGLLVLATAGFAQVDSVWVRHYQFASSYPHQYMNYGRVSFAIIEDRKFKSGPAGLSPPESM